MKKKNRFKVKNKHLLVILTFFCITGIVLTASAKISFAPVRNVASMIILPFQKGINNIGTFLTDARNITIDKEQLLAENEELRKQVDELKELAVLKETEEEELQRLRDIYNLDHDYSEYNKIAANVISKDPSNWYSTFMINRGSNDGIQENMNVIAKGGLVGIVIEVGSDWASVRSIIDDNSNVSAMTMTTADNCIVSGDLTLRDKGKLAFTQMNTENETQEGEKLVTSNISDKYLPNILIGYLDEINVDSNHLTKTGTLIPAVDFQHLQEVLVITTLKQTGGN